MLGWLDKRAVRPELMDDFSAGGDELREALRQLRMLNAMFGASGPTLYGVKRIWEKAGKPARMKILDVGCGSGDVNRALLRWADRNGIHLSVILADVTEVACEEARRYYRNEPRIQIVRQDLFRLPEFGADIVTATQLLHHFPANDLAKVVRQLLNVSRIGVVINDIHRHPVPWTAVWLVTRLLSRNRYLRHDGPLSVAKGFRMAEWQFLDNIDMAAEWNASWRPLFRYAVTVLKNKTE